MNSQMQWRNRIAPLLRENKVTLALELLLVVIFQILHVLRVVPTAVIFIFFLGWLSLWLRKNGWRDVGLKRPANWSRTIGIGIIAAIIFQAISILIIVPVLEKITNTPLDLGQFEPLRHNLPFFIISIVASWTYAAFIEEMAYRGYLLNRFKDFFRASRIGWALATLASSILFGLGHTYQGANGVLDTFISACMMAGLYFLGKRNLWLPIIVHGAKDTIGFSLIFFGLYP